MSSKKCYRLGCRNEVVGVVEDIKSLCYKEPVCREHQSINKIVQSHLDCLETKKEIADGIEEEDEEEVCELCGGKNGEHEDVSTMERVYPNEPHMADIGSAPCPNSIRDDSDDYDDQE